MDKEFTKSLIALGELTSRKHELRRKWYFLVGIAIIPPIVLIGVLLTARFSLYWILLGSAASFTIAEAIARSKMPALAEQVAADHGIPLERLLDDSKHVDSAM